MIRIWELSLPSNLPDDTTSATTAALTLNQTSTTESPNKKIKAANSTDQKKEKVNGHTNDDDMQIELADDLPQQVEVAPDMSIGTLVGFVETGRRITCMTTVDVQDVIGEENDNENGEEDEESDSDDSEDE